MADDVVECVSTFLIHTCQPSHRLNYDAVSALVSSVRQDDVPLTAITLFDWIPLLTGSVAELYIQPMLPCVSDYDAMFYRSDQLAIPEGYLPPTLLPAEFGNVVYVHEIVESEFPSYVYLMRSYILVESDSGEYMAVKLLRELYMTYKTVPDIAGIEAHGPAWTIHRSYDVALSVGQFIRYFYTTDVVPCIRCLSWPSQAADWPREQRHCGWPYSATVDLVKSIGCDLVCVAHPRCREDAWESSIQHRLSFSRAEIVLINSWMPEQQIVYHMLRIFVKIEQLTNSPTNSEADKSSRVHTTSIVPPASLQPTLKQLSNYHIKTLMLWACELKTNKWWTVKRNVVEIYVELLQVLSVWLQEARCKHYFINNCNLLRSPDCATATILMSVEKEWLAEWFVTNYIYKYAEFCRNDYNVQFHTLKRYIATLSPQADFALWRVEHSLSLSFINFSSAEQLIAKLVSSAC